MASSSLDSLERPGTDRQRGALLELLAFLRANQYEFVTATPATHARVVARQDRQRAGNLRDVLGWSLPFAPGIVPPSIVDLLEQADALAERDDGLLAAGVRVSSVRGALFLHSAYPTLGEQSVFLGPDSYRFADLIVARMGTAPHRARILDYGAGAGVGGITAALNAPGAGLVLADINPKALFLASVNAEFAGIDYATSEVSRPADLDGDFDLIVTHPPFMMDGGKRAYRDGGDLFGGQLSLDWVCDGMGMLRLGGRLISHTGASIVGGRDVLRDALRERVPATGFAFDYDELDPDIFGDELDKPAYSQVERIAAVGIVLTRMAASPA